MIAEIMYEIGCASSIPIMPIAEGRIKIKGIKNNPFCDDARNKALPVFPML